MGLSVCFNEKCAFVCKTMDNISILFRPLEKTGRNKIVSKLNGWLNQFYISLVGWVRFKKWQDQFGRLRYTLWINLPQSKNQLYSLNFIYYIYFTFRNSICRCKALPSILRPCQGLHVLSHWRFIIGKIVNCLELEPVSSPSFMKSLLRVWAAETYISIGSF